MNTKYLIVLSAFFMFSCYSKSKNTLPERQLIEFSKQIENYKNDTKMKIRISFKKGDILPDSYKTVFKKYFTETNNGIATYRFYTNRATQIFILIQDSNNEVVRFTNITKRFKSKS